MGYIFWQSFGANLISNYIKNDDGVFALKLQEWDDDTHSEIYDEVFYHFLDYHHISVTNKSLSRYSGSELIDVKNGFISRRSSNCL